MNNKIIKNINTFLCRIIFCENKCSCMYVYLIKKWYENNCNMAFVSFSILFKNSQKVSLADSKNKICLLTIKISHVKVWIWLCRLCSIYTSLLLISLAFFLLLLKKFKYAKEGMGSYEFYLLNWCGFRVNSECWMMDRLFYVFIILFMEGMVWIVSRWNFSQNCE